MSDVEITLELIFRQGQRILGELGQIREKLDEMILREERHMATERDPLDTLRVGRREKLIGRLENLKFDQAKSYTEDISEPLRQVVDALAALWGDTGWARGGALGVVLEYTVTSLVADIQTDAAAPPEEPLP